MALNISRGCSLCCTFCSDNAFYTGCAANMSPERIVSLMEKTARYYGINSVYLAGDDYFLDNSRVRGLCHLLIKRKLKVKWSCDVNSSLSEEEAVLMAKAGCASVIMGVESGSQRMLDFLGKGNVRKIEKTFRILVKHRITPTLFLMYGYPTETTKDFQMTLDLIKRLDNPPYLLMKFVPYLQTILLKYCLEDGTIESLPQNLSDWAEFPLTYTKEINLSKVPQETIEEAMADYARTYSINRLKFTLKYKPTYFLTAFSKPVEFFRALRNLARYHFLKKAISVLRLRIKKNQPAVFHKTMVLRNPATWVKV